MHTNADASKCPTGFNLTETHNGTDGSVNTTCIDVNECTVVTDLCLSYANTTIFGGNLTRSVQTVRCNMYLCRLRCIHVGEFVCMHTSCLYVSVLYM